MQTSENIRKVVGRERAERPLQRVYELKRRLEKLGVREKEDERIRKVVGRPEEDGR